MFNVRFFSSCSMLALAGALGGCVGAGSDSIQQQLEVHTILDHHEVPGVGCVLSNSAGRWFVVAPGRVMVVRTRDALRVDCAREGTGDAREDIAARPEGRLDLDKLIGNIVVSSPLDTYFDRLSGVGMGYPSTLTVLMRPAAGKAEESELGNNVVF